MKLIIRNTTFLALKLYFCNIL